MLMDRVVTIPVTWSDPKYQYNIVKLKKKIHLGLCNSKQCYPKALLSLTKAWFWNSQSLKVSIHIKISPDIPPWELHLLSLCSTFNFNSAT